jgi:hypothetical protein
MAGGIICIKSTKRGDSSGSGDFPPAPSQPGGGGPGRAGSYAYSGDARTLRICTYHSSIL